MLNRSGITKTKLTNTTQILANVELQSSVGCIVKQDVGVLEGTRKIAKAGTPLKIDLKNLKTPAVLADESANPMTAVLLHDVDVTEGNANGTALLFGFINYDRIDEAIRGKVDTAVGNAAATKLVTFIKFN